MNESPICEHWLYQVLSTDPQIQSALGNRIFSGAIPQKVEFPYCFFFLQSGMDVQGLGTVRTKARLLYAIRVIERGRMSEGAILAANRIDEIVGKAVQVVHMGLEISGRREQPLRYTDFEGDIRFDHLGGVYALEVYQMP